MRALPAVRRIETPMRLGRVQGASVYVQDFPHVRTETLLLSEPHHLITRRSQKGSAYYQIWSGGGPFYQHTYEVMPEVNPLEFDHRYFGPQEKYILGAPIPLLSPSLVPANPANFSQSYLPDLLADHATGWSRTRPGRPEGNIGQFLLELRDLPKIPFRKAFFKRGSVLAGLTSISEMPRLLYSELKKFRNLGSEYLNLEFGWKPFVRDVRQMFHIWQDVDKALAKIIRENGKGLRRRMTLEESTDTDSKKSNGTYLFTPLYCAVPDTHLGTYYLESVRTVKTRVWYSARYHYYIPESHLQSSLWTKAAKAALFGVLPTPELLWEILPWSWLIDWFSNVGDVMSNLSWSPAENLVADYSYIMKNIKEEVVTTLWCHGKSQSGTYHHFKGVDHSFQRVERREVKLRYGGSSPFGLGVKLPSLSGRQLGILAALGISRSRVL